MSKIQVNKLHTLTGHNHSIFALTDGIAPHMFYTGSGDGMVVEWDLSQPGDGRLLAKLPASVYALCVDRKQGILYIGQNFEGIHAIDLESKQEIWSLKITSNAIFDLKIVGNLLLAATGDGVLVVLDLKERSPLKHIKVSTESLRVLAMDPSHSQLAIGSSDHTVKVFSLKDWEPVALLAGHTNSVFALDFSPDGKVLISGGRDAHLKIWDTNGFGEIQDIVAHMYAINYLSFRDDGRYFVTCSMDKSIKLWDAREFKLLKVIDKARHAGHGTSINKVKWTAYHQQIVAVSDDHTISVWEIEL
ncbi:WD40 repeat domain-containing protein [Negadavirga shengliensis]|uniref:WD40 repeat domain-containing protein n=1 Tax=Negadavirga shengliensis TaxID=1389218 RepID=A0ABV9T6H4_9BACT